MDQFLTSVDAALLGVVVATFAFLLATRSYLIAHSLYTLTPSAKLWDRIYELDKLVLAHPGVFARYMQEVGRKQPFFYADSKIVARDDLYYQLKAVVYLHLNIFEEIYLTTEASRSIARRFERDGWDKYIFRKMRHPLLREVFDQEADIIYSGKFNDFIRRNRKEIDRPADRNAF